MKQKPGLLEEAATDFSGIRGLVVTGCAVGVNP